MERKLLPTWGSSEKHRRSQKCLNLGDMLGTRMVHNKNASFFFGGSSFDVLEGAPLMCYGSSFDVFLSLSSLLGKFSS